MITESNVRNNDFSTKLTRSDRKIGEIITGIMKFEIAFGGRIISADPCKIVIATQVLGAHDVVTITSDTPEELLPLFEVIHIYDALVKQITTEHKMKCIEPIKNKEGGFSPLLVRSFASMLMGMSNVKQTMLVAFAAKTLKPENTLQQLIEKNKSIKDDPFKNAIMNMIYPCYELIIDDKVSAEEALELLLEA
jgi:hypothetical protein